MSYLKIWEIKEDSYINEDVYNILSLNYILEDAKSELAARIFVGYGDGKNIYSLLRNTLYRDTNNVIIKVGNFFLTPSFRGIYDEPETEEETGIKSSNFCFYNLKYVTREVISYIEKEVLNEDLINLIKSSTEEELRNKFINFDYKVENLRIEQKYFPSLEEEEFLKLLNNQSE